MKQMVKFIFVFTALIPMILSGHSISVYAESKNIIINTISERSYPLFTLTDSLSVALIDDRMDCYLLRSSSGDLNAPEPLSNIGYQGVTLNSSLIRNDNTQFKLSNGGVALSYSTWGNEHRFFDYKSEFEKMIVRFCKRAIAISPAIDSQKILNVIPDSLTEEYTETGFFTIEENGTTLSSMFNLDISMLGSGYHYFSKQQDSLICTDIQIGRGSGVPYVLKAPYGIFDADVLPGLPQFSGITMNNDYKSLLESYLTVFNKGNIIPPQSGYQQGSNIVNQSKTGKIFIVKTSEGGYAALVFAGTYIGGIDRTHFWYFYSTNNVFTKSTTATTPITKSSNLNKGVNFQKKITVNLEGQKSVNAKTHSGQKFPTLMLINSKK